MQSAHLCGPEGLVSGPRGGSLLLGASCLPRNVNVISPTALQPPGGFLRAFRSGLLGPVMLDCDLLQGRSMEEEEP